MLKQHLSHVSIQCLSKYIYFLTKGTSSWRTSQVLIVFIIQQCFQASQVFYESLWVEILYIIKKIIMQLCNRTPYWNKETNLGMLYKISRCSFLTRHVAILCLKDCTLSANEEMIAALDKITCLQFVFSCLFFSTLPPIPPEDTCNTQPILSKELSAPKFFYDPF